MNKKYILNGSIGLIIIVFAMLFGLMLQFPKIVTETISVPQYSSLPYPTQQKFKILKANILLSEDEYKRSIIEKGFQNTDGAITLIEPIEIQTRSHHWIVDIIEPEKQTVFIYDGIIIHENDELELKSSSDFEKFQTHIFEKRFDENVLVEIEKSTVQGAIDFNNSGTYPVKISYESRSLNFSIKINDLLKKEIAISESASNTNPSSGSEIENIPTDNRSTVTLDIHDELVLVNKNRPLDANAVPKLVTIPSNYGVSEGYRVTQNTKDNFVILVDTIFEETGLWMRATSAYRSYDYQSGLYNRYVKSHGQAEADRFSAKPGYSEHQTGLAIDVVAPGFSMDDFGLSEQSAWVNKNAHRFGFIVRYQEGKEHITGYMPESWHLRYIGSIATAVYNSGLTYDEWYVNNR